MKRGRSETDYRIVGESGEWFAWRRGLSLQRWWAHVRAITTRQGGRWVNVTAVVGRTPSEALERLKRIERREA